MAWNKKSVMEQKEMFIKMWETEKYTTTALCKRFGISRVTGHKLIKKYQEEGEESFFLKSKSPKSLPHKTPKRIEEKIIKLRKKHKNWGARKLKVLLEREIEIKKIPSETTINAILKRNGLIKTRRRRMGKEGRLNPKFDPKENNEIWSADYKGKFKIGNGRYCNPLTVCDSKSRLILGIKCHYKATYSSVKQGYISVFREYGLPEYLHTDNGNPFGSIKSPRRFSRLCYWLIDVGVLPVFSDPGCPQQNGRHERMHRDLKAYCKPRIMSTLSKQQEVMDEFREEYNEIRPHESLKMKTPEFVHEKSKREYSERKILYEYPIDYKIMKVTINGSARWGAYHWVYVSRAARGRYVGAEEIGNGIWNVYYRDVLLGYFDEKVLVRDEQYVKLSRIKV